MDLTFVGLESVPGPGEERFAGALMRSPGGGAINAIGAARLGLRTALASPLGEDIEGRPSARARGGGDRVSTRAGARTADHGRDAVGRRARDGDVRPGAGHARRRSPRFAPRAVIVGLHQLDLAPRGASVYATCGDDGARLSRGTRRGPWTARAPCSSTPARGWCSRGRARRRTSARELGERVEVAVVTLGPEGALARVDGGLVRAPGFDVEPVDTTGAGDLLCSAFVWAELRRADVETALRWAVLYASLSVAVPTGAAGAVTRERLFEEGATRGLPPLALEKETRT